MHYTANIWQFRRKKRKLIRNQMIVFFFKLNFDIWTILCSECRINFGFSHVCIARLKLSTVNKTTLDFRCCWSWMGAYFVWEHLHFFEMVDFCFVWFFCVFICQYFLSSSSSLLVVVSLFIFSCVFVSCLFSSQWI